MRARHRWLVACASILLLAAIGVTITLQVTGGSGRSVPSSLNTSCGSDDTSALESWFYRLPQGSPSNPTQVNFGGGCYLVDGEIYLRGFRDFVFDGEGATFEQRTPVNGETSDEALIPRPAYCGYGGWTKTRYTQDQKLDIMWLVEGGCDLTFENMTIVGENQGSPGKGDAQDSFIAFDGTQRVVVQNMTMRGPYGDYVDIGGLHEAPYGGGAYPSTDVTVRGCRLSGSGRQGIAIVLAKRVTIEDNTILSAPATVFDIEFDADVPAGIQTDILIADNTIVGQHFAFLIAAITAAKIERLRFTGNDMIDGAQMRIWIDPKTQSSDIRVDHNVSTGAADWPRRASVTVIDTSFAEVDDNTVVVPIYQPGDRSGGPFVTGGPGVEVDHNTLTQSAIGRQIAGSEIVVEGGARSCSDVSHSGTPFDRPCSLVRTPVPPVGAGGIR